MSIEIRRNEDRFLTEVDGKRTRHSFSYGAHYDPENVGFGPIRAINTEHLDPGAGYEPHRHSDVEIVTWVITGALRHSDSAGGGGVIPPGVAQRLSAGDGAEHSEVNDSQGEPLEFIQMMLASERLGRPEYESVTVDEAPGTLWPGPHVHAPAHMFVGRVAAGLGLLVPASPRALVHVARGTAEFAGERLAAGDEARLTQHGAFELTGDAEVLIWQID